MTATTGDTNALTKRERERERAIETGNLHRKGGANRRAGARVSFVCLFVCFFLFFVRRQNGTRARR